MVPQGSLREFYLPITAFNVGKDTKNGCQGFWNNLVVLFVKQTICSIILLLSCLGGCFEPWIHFPEVYPQNNQICIHVNEFLKDGYRVSAESIEVRFPHVDGSRVINDGTVGITDGYCKLIIMTGVLVIAHSLEAQPTYLWECLKTGDPDTYFSVNIFISLRHSHIFWSHGVGIWMNGCNVLVSLRVRWKTLLPAAQNPVCQSAAQELPREELDRDDVERVFKSFRHVRCSYTHYANPSHHHLHALRF